MVDLLLSEREQRALRTLASAEPVPGRPLPTREVLDALGTLVPADEVGVGYADDTGRVLQVVSIAGTLDDLDPQVCDGPLMVGQLHLSAVPDLLHYLHERNVRDEMWLGFRNGARHVVQLDLYRRTVPFDARDEAMLRMVAPLVQRLVRERPTPQLPATLTVQERRILMRVAAGHTNGEIAQSLSIAPSTVRKHLEHAYRKLGVENRVAAVARMQGRDTVDVDLRERLERYA